ncbi:hypothetical protein JB92DRAFT_2905024 [Gautieria morchelliformis]|nr:hypothetical protein JB92DRAFT_2905024 [Gautieria morchelliformis]
MLPLHLFNHAVGLLASLQPESHRQAAFLSPYDSTTPPILTVPPARWAALNASVGGRLFPGVPFAKPCFAKYEGWESGVEIEGCEGVRRGYGNESIRTSSRGGQINTQWETCQARSEACLLDYVDPYNPETVKLPNECHQGSVSHYYIDVRIPGDVQAALAFARTSGVPLVIKNTGHDYKGRSSAPYSLALWMHSLREMKYHSSFAPTCPEGDGDHAPQQAVTLGAGVQWFEAYAFAEEKGITLVGGADRTVGAAGGWLQGGGHGALSNTLGMGADRVLEFVVVTPDGELRIANRCQNEDLFFALRGGGGGTFGVVLSATTRADPKVTMQAVLVEFPAGMSMEGIKTISEEAGKADKNHVNGDGDESNDPLALTRSFWSLLVTHALRWVEEGWGAYVNANSALYLTPALGKEAAQESMRELVEWGKRLKAGAGEEEGKGVVVIQGEYDSWGHCYNTFADANSADLGEPLALASRLIPESSFATADTRAELVDALIAAERDAPGVRLLKTTPFNYAKRLSSDATSTAINPETAVNPAWRTSIIHVTTVARWNWNATRTQVHRQYDAVTRAIEHLRRITGKGAAYVNEADVYEKDHEEVFWGEHYARLMEIKNKYDPDRLLDCWHCVGWQSGSPRFSCYL